MPQYYFDIHDGKDFSADEVGVDCKTLADVSDYAVTVLPDIARDELPNGPNRVFWVKAHMGDGKYLFRASLVLATAWLVERPNGGIHPGETLKLAALKRLKGQIAAMRRDLAEDQLSHELHEIDALLGVTQSETDRMIARLARSQR
ncbi:DUF6894 family protein [Mesorhizobium loti]|uniref:DUF6894 domain-containing protein n=1 Tax=Mesorhizobium loti R88b TaxID=935548 RepID=A0A6M7WLI0_RHILI|nr:hypothetical protein [Mesorhizobium loti]QKD02695.1 hypothetical protein EB235_15275 [Mesorhizobium loti R88b]